MIGLGIALVTLGYGLGYYAMGNLRSGGKGPTFQETFGLPNALAGIVNPGATGSSLGEDAGDLANQIAKNMPNLTGQPPSSTTSPGDVRPL